MNQSEYNPVICDDFPKRVLLAEDDDETRCFLASMLRRKGYNVIDLSSGIEVFNHLGVCLFEGGAAPDVIVSDLRMPDFSGLQVLDCIERAELHIPFILITAHGNELIRTQALRAGATAVLTKPFEFDELLDAVHQSTGTCVSDPNALSFVRSN